MTLEEALQLDAAAFWQNAEIVLAIQTALNPGPWDHAFDYADFAKHRDPDRKRCSRCGGKWENDIGKKRRGEPCCPVPPPLEMKPEVVARKLRDRLLEGPYDWNAIALIAVKVGNRFKANNWWRAYSLAGGLWWYGWEATPEQQALTCLVALGQFKTEKEI